MSFVFRDVIIQFEGKDYHVTPNLKLLRLIESGGVSLAAMANGLASGAPQISHVAYVLYHMLKSAGADVTEDDVYFAIINASEAQSVAWVRSVVEAFAPGSIDEKKPDAPRKQSKANGRK